MVMQTGTQGSQMPGQFGEWLAEATTGLPDWKYKPRQMKQEISRFEKDIETSEKLINATLVNFVEFVRQAGQDDDAARKFDKWTDDYDLAETLVMCEEKIIPGMSEHAEILRKIVDGWHRMADAGLIEPDLPTHLTERVVQLDERIRDLTEQVTRKHDNDLIARLLMRVGKQRQLTLAEQLRLADAVIAGLESVRRALPAPRGLVR